MTSFFDHLDPILNEAPLFCQVQGIILGTSYIAPVKRENEKISSFVKTASYKTVLILGTLLL
jgi:hypothetical protein